jgi:hypothetical protein
MVIVVEEEETERKKRRNHTEATEKSHFISVASV